MIKKTIAILLIIIFCLFSLTGCYNAEGIETVAYAVAIGIDKGENNEIKLSLQFALTNNSKEGRRKQPVSKLNYNCCRLCNYRFRNYINKQLYK